MSAEAWLAFTGLALTVLGSACGLAWKMGRWEEVLDDFTRNVAGNTADHVEFREGIAQLREHVGVMQGRPLPA